MKNVNRFLIEGTRLKFSGYRIQSSVDNLSIVGHEVSRLFRNKKKEYMTARINELETDSKINNIRDLCMGINEFKGYRPRPNIVMNEKGELVTDCHSILARWRNHLSQLKNIYGVDVVRLTKIHTAEPLVPELSVFEVGMAIGKLKSHIITMY
jgi:hypothetical protein